MWFELGRRISVIMLIVAFATGGVVPAVQAHSHQISAIAAVSMDNHGDCTNEKYPPAHQKDIQGTCCVAGSVVSVVLPASIGLYLANPPNSLLPSLDRIAVGRTIAPDPHPPKQVALI